MSILKRLGWAVAAAGIICVGAAMAQSDSIDRDRCGDNAFPTCSKIGQELGFSMRTGRNNAPGSIDPLWTANGGMPVTQVIQTAWAANGGAPWVSAYASGSQTEQSPGGVIVYQAKVWMEEDPYYYEKILMNLKIGADNTIVSVKVNGTVVFTGNGGIYDFLSGGFDGVNVTPAVAASVFRKGCNLIEIETSDDGVMAGLSVVGQIRAVCSKCTTPKPAAAY